jgi:hypothetical protein
MQAGFAVVADHRAEVLGFHDPVDGDDRQTLGLQLAIAVVTGRQATGDDQRIAAARAEQLQQLALAVRRVVGAGDQQLIAASACALLQQFGDPRVTGVFQIRQNKAHVRVCRLRSPAAWGLGVKPCCSTTARTRSTWRC